ncbi:MAG: hypothetical protein C0469_00010 [Cyanobacteria bacterium DS2.3.42]|nr:hypothetical protein [Cyanobacteria bacterium DS2.3.42]
MSPSKIDRPGPALGPIACSTCRNSGDAPGSRRTAGAQTPNRGGEQSSLAILIVFLCALEALLIWAASDSVSNAFILLAEIALIVIGCAGYRFYKWVFDDQSVSQSSRRTSSRLSFIDEFDTLPRDSFSERLRNSRSGTYAAGAAGIGLGASDKNNSKSSDSSGCAASTPVSSCGGGAFTCGGGCSCGGGGCGGC